MLGSLSLIFCTSLFAQEKFNDTTYLEPVEVTAVRAAENNPFTKTNLSKAALKTKNIGQDLPFILQQTPALVANSDAGNGIGYTGLRIRGADAARINITLNGIPYNDAESQGAFLVNIPDLVASAGSIQIQRGVGTSTNGAAAFAGSINISTNEINTNKNFEINNSYGSYNSYRNSLLYNSGLLGNKFTIDARLSKIHSDGYIDRASTNLRSLYLSTAYVSKKNSLRFNVISGREKTYQAWNGVDEATLQTDRTYNSSGTEKTGEPYKNETDNYWQTHYQLFYNHKVSETFKFNIAAFLTRGKGYYEQYKADKKFSSYGLPNYTNTDTTIKRTDLVRRLWLDNYFYGSLFSLHYKKGNTQLIFGGSVQQYKGDHYGEIVKTIIPVTIPANYKWYNNPASKNEQSAYLKWTQKIFKNIESFVDVQGRNIDYSINGFRDNPTIKIKKDYTFFNPKVGLSYYKNNWSGYVSYARASKEPNRDDFEADVLEIPKPEQLNDYEMGVAYKTSTGNIGANVYYMKYKDQLVLTGKINDVGAYTRINIPNSYRLGLEIQAAKKINTWLNFEGNISLSENKLKNFTEFIDDYDNGNQQTKFYNSGTLAFSPSVVAGYGFTANASTDFSITLLGKYVGNQYLDNSSSKNKSLDAYYTQDLRLAYQFKMKRVKNILAFVQVNNLFNNKYEANGYTFSYYAGTALTTENYYFPMAPINFMTGLNLSF